MDIAQFIRENGVYAKLVAALDDIRNGNGWAVFNGLQNGEVIVKIRYDGEHCVFARPVLDNMPESNFPAVPAVKTQEAETVAATSDVIEKPEEGVNVTEETQIRKRRQRY